MRSSQSRTGAAASIEAAWVYDNGERSERWLSACLPRGLNGLPRDDGCGKLVRMTAISISELHQNTDLWVRKATEQEPIVLTDKGQAVAKIVPVAAKVENPFFTRKLLPGFAELQARLSGGTDSTQIISEMRDGR